NPMPVIIARSVRAGPSASNTPSSNRKRLISRYAQVPTETSGSVRIPRCAVPQILRSHASGNTRSNDATSATTMSSTWSARAMSAPFAYAVDPRHAVEDEQAEQAERDRDRDVAVRDRRTDRAGRPDRGGRRDPVRFGA